MCFEMQSNVPNLVVALVDRVSAKKLARGAHRQIGEPDATSLSHPAGQAVFLHTRGGWRTGIGWVTLLYVLRAAFAWMAWQKLNGEVTAILFLSAGGKNER